MMKHKLLLLFSIALILMVIPSVFAQDNSTVSLESNLNSSTYADDFYFDSNALNDHGDGTPDNPYKELRDGRILDGSVIHLKNGEYSLDQTNTHKNITFIGEDASKTIIKGNDGVLLVNKRLVLSNVTISNLTIFNQGNIYASNVIFTDSLAAQVNHDKSYGGAIHCVDKNHNAYLNNCTFINNHAGYGGAIYINGGILEIADCIFINNTAVNYGGAIACDSRSYVASKVSIKRTKFIGSSSLSDAGGAIFIKTGIFTGEDLYFSSNNATFGGAICLLKSYSSLDNLTAYNNSAKYDGGVIYQIYGNLTLTNSQLHSNHAKNGGALFSDSSFYCCVENNFFINNSAQLLAGAFYSLINDYFKIDNLTYINNTALEYNDFYKQDNISLIFSSSNYTFYNNQLDDSPLPSKYSSQLTPIKNQLDGGNCWAFSALATIEASIIKASGDYMDLSEENMKNLASIYSHFGWEMNTNEGGYPDMSFGYLVSWLGPVLEKDDEYSDITTLSPILDSVLHIQNMLFLRKSSHSDLNHIKKAIRDYGGVYTGIFMNAYYDSEIAQYVQCYRGNFPCNHAVVLIGWDDDFYIPGAPGKGAWLAKNSWGENWGDKGYFYVSYFDNSCPKLDDNAGAIAFIFNDTIRYDKNYQYDVAKTDYFFNTTNTVWYKNLFTATDDEYLAAVSTYFEKQTSWELSISVNDILKLTKSGKSDAGYYTLDLGEFIPINVGDIFEIVFKITVSGDAGVPISESISLNNYFYHENISYISYDGSNWKDLFNLNWSYPDHVYSSQVACIKAFTVLNPVQTTVALTMENKTTSNGVVVAKVLNQWGYPVNCGKVTFKVREEIFTVDVVNGIAKQSIELKSTNITAQFAASGYASSNASAELKNPLVKTNMTLNITGAYNPINVTATITDEYGNPVKCGSVTFEITGKKYDVEVVNGTAKLENVNVNRLNFNVYAYYNNIFYYGPSNITSQYQIFLIDTRIYLNITADETNNPINVTAHIFDVNGNPVKRGSVTFRMSDKIYILNVVEGMVNLMHTFTDIGENMISATYYDDNLLYNSSVISKNVTVSKMKINLTFDMTIEGCDAIFAIGIKDYARGFKIIIRLNDNTTYSYLSTDGKVLSEIKDLKKGFYNYVIELDSPIYESDDLRGVFEIIYQKTQLVAADATIYYGGEYSVCLKDVSGNIIPDRDVYLTIDGHTYKKRTNAQGIAIFNIPISNGLHQAKVNFIGDDEFIKSSTTVNIASKSTIAFSSYKYSMNSRYLATLRDIKGNLLLNKQVNVVLNGVEYNVTTDSNGQVSLNLNINAGLYSVKITNPDSGEVQGQNINIVKRITQNSDLTMYYGAGKLFKVRVCDDFGKFAKGIKVTFKINGKTYHALTDNHGYVSVKISQKPGKYTITVEYNSLKVSNKVTVKSTIISKDVKVKKGKTIKFTVKLVNKNGKVLKNKKITFKFKGKTYKVKTNKKGKATLKITKKYKKGKYSISSKYGKLTIKNKITIK